MWAMGDPNLVAHGKKTRETRDHVHRFAASQAGGPWPVRQGVGGGPQLALLLLVRGFSSWLSGSSRAGSLEGAAAKPSNACPTMSYLLEGRAASLVACLVPCACCCCCRSNAATSCLMGLGPAGAAARPAIACATMSYLVERGGACVVACLVRCCCCCRSKAATSCLMGLGPTGAAASPSTSCPTMSYLERGAAFVAACLVPCC